MMIIKPVDIRRAAMDLLARREHGFDELALKLQKRFTRKPRSYQKGTQEDIQEEMEADFALGQQAQLDSPEVSLTEQIQLAIEQLKSEGLQSDERMAEAFVRARSNRGQGPMKIKAELRQKGIADYLVSSAISAAGVDWYELAAAVANRRFPECPDLATKAKRSRFLQQRGFSFDQIGALD